MEDFGQANPISPAPDACLGTTPLFMAVSTPQASPSDIFLGHHLDDFV